MNASPKVLARACLAAAVTACGTTPPATLGRDVLAFDSDRTGNFEIFTMRDDGSRQTQITSDARYDSWWPKISPDRTKILFVRSPYFSPDGTRIAWLTVAKPRFSVFSILPDGTGLTELTPTAPGNNEFPEN